MKKIFRIPLLAILTMAIGLFILDMVFPGSVTEILFLEFAQTQKLIKSGNPVFCELGLEKIKSLSPNEKVELKEFLVREFSEGPRQLRRAERMNFLFGVNDMILDEPAEHCMFKVVMNLATETPELLPLLARSDNFKGYSRHLTLEAIEKYIQYNPASISHFTSHLKDHQSTEGSLAAALFESAGESGIQIVMSELIKALDSTEKKPEPRQILFYWSMIEKFLRKNANEKFCPAEIATIILHPNLEKQLGIAMINELVGIFGYTKLPADLIAVVSANRASTESALWQVVKTVGQGWLASTTRRSLLAIAMDRFSSGFWLRDEGSPRIPSRFRCADKRIH